jgi:hypothetical protein
MALLPPSFLDGVVAIGFPGGDPTGQPTDWVGTGFVFFEVLAEDDETLNGNTYLVTNRHLFGTATSAKIRCNPSGAGPAQEFLAELTRPDGSPQWIGHPDPAVDIAVLPIDFNVFVDRGMAVVPFLSSQHVLTRQEMRAEKVSEGDEVFVLGFPMAMVGADRNFVIVRSGSIARVRDLLDGSSGEFLVDATVFPGNSGGPVILKPETRSLEGTQAHDSAKLIGIVGAYLPYHDEAVSSQTGRRRVVFEENTGLSVVHPVDHVLEAIAAHHAAEARTA